jgi:hypothetical protein
MAQFNFLWKLWFHRVEENPQSFGSIVTDDAIATFSHPYRYTLTF